jgi:hypothetical protein
MSGGAVTLGEIAGRIMMMLEAACSRAELSAGVVGRCLSA